MDVEKRESQITLIYHDMRGMAQNIRYLLYFLDIPFTEIHPQGLNDLLTLKILQGKKYSEESELPYLVDGDLVIQDLYAIIKHLCVKTKRQDLLGQTIEQRALIRQIYYNFLLKKKKSIKILFKFGEQACKCPQKFEEVRKQAMNYFSKEAGALIQMVTLKNRKPQQRYIFSHITILDFLLYEDCFYQINLFGNLEEKNCKILQTINSIFGTELTNIKNQNSMFLKVMRQFKQNFETEPFYVKNKEKLESYSVVCPIMSQFTKAAFRKVWLGPGHYIK